MVFDELAVRLDEIVDGEYPDGVQRRKRPVVGQTTHCLRQFGEVFVSRRRTQCGRSANRLTVRWLFSLGTRGAELWTRRGSVSLIRNGADVYQYFSISHEVLFLEHYINLKLGA